METRSEECFQNISIHALREEGDYIDTDGNYITTLISIHALREEGDMLNSTTLRFLMHFYPRPPRGGRLSYYDPMLANLGISIHALREEGDDIVPFPPSL